jgi:hypothetical protein
LLPPWRTSSCSPGRIKFQPIRESPSCVCISEERYYSVYDGFTNAGSTSQELLLGRQSWSLARAPGGSIKSLFAKTHSLFRQINSLF